MPWQAVYIYTSSHLQQQTKTQIYSNTTWPQVTLHKTIHAKGYLSFKDTYPDSYNCLFVLYVLCLAAYLTAVCPMQCQAAFNMDYAVLGNFQCILYSFSHSIHHIYTILWTCLSKLYSITIYLGHQMNIFGFLYTKNHNFLKIYPIVIK